MSLEMKIDGEMWSREHCIDPEGTPEEQMLSLLSNTIEDREYSDDRTVILYDSRLEKVKVRGRLQSKLVRTEIARSTMGRLRELRPLVPKDDWYLS